MDLFPKNNSLMYLSALVLVLMGIMAISLSNLSKKSVSASYAQDNQINVSESSSDKINSF